MGGNPFCHSVLQERLGLSCSLYFFSFFFFDLGRCKDACRLDPSWFYINWCSLRHHFLVKAHSFSPPLNLFKGRGRNNSFSRTSKHGFSQGFSYHLHSSFSFTSLPLSENPIAGIDSSCSIW